MLNKIKKITLYFIFFYTLLGFIVIPLILKPQLINIIESNTYSKIDIDSISFNPFIFKLEIDEIKLNSLDRYELAYIKQLSLNVEPSSLLFASIHVKNFIVKEPRISLVLDKDKKINFTSIIKNEEKNEQSKDDEKSSSIPRIIIDKVAIVDGSLDYEDYTRKSKFEFGLDTIGFELNNIDTQDLNASDANIRFYSLLADGGFIDFKSEIVSLEPLEVKGSLDFEASKLYTQWRYIKDSLNLEIADGKLSIHTNYYLNLDDLNSTTISDLDLNLDKLRVKPKGPNRDVLNLSSLSVEDAVIQPLKQDVHIQKIMLESLSVKVKRDENGDIDWSDYVKTNFDNNLEDSTKNEVVEEEDSKPWNLLIDKIALQKINVDFQDNGVKANVNTVLNELNLYAQNVTLKGDEPLEYQMNLLLNDSFKCDSNGSVIHKILDAKTYTKCSGLDVEHFVPYIDEIAKKELKVYDLKLRSLIAGFDANVSAKDINSTVVLDVSDANIYLDNFAINQDSIDKRLATFSSFYVNGITLNTKSKELDIADTKMKNLYVRVKRFKDSKFNILGLVEPKLVKKLEKEVKVAEEKQEYRIKLKKVALESAKVTFEDSALTKKVTNKIDKIYLTANNIDSKNNTWLNYNISANVNDKGKIKVNGGIRHTPYKQKENLKIDKISLKSITPYIQEYAYITVSDGYFSLDTKNQFEVNKDKPDLNVNGSIKLEEIFINDSRDNTPLISFSNINLKQITLEVMPNRLFIDSVDVDAFYVNTIIDANKTMNFASLAKAKDNQEPEDATDVNVTKTEQFPIKIAKVNLLNGSAYFSDHSLPLDFKTNIHDINGEIYSISTSANERTYVDILGQVDRYGSTKLNGSINSGDPKAFTDLDFNFKNLELSSVSGYSGEFAGYKIDKGKLFLDLKYDIEESKLLGENSIVIKNIELGDEIENDTNSSLPLGFVIALLEDSDGVIDIEMPVEGNVDEPDFKYGALVWKTLSKLILKAVASPFTFLGSMMGIDGEKLNYAEFEGGSSKILPPEQEKLDNIAKLLLKRPKISISIGGTYNPDIDKKAIQKNKLINLVAELSGAKNEKERINAMTINLLEDIYEDARDDDKIEDIEDSLDEKYDGDEFDRYYLNALIQECSAIQDVTIQDLQDLAIKRSSVIKEYLIEKKAVQASRIAELEVQSISTDESGLVKSKLEVTVK